MAHSLQDEPHKDTSIAQLGTDGASLFLMWSNLLTSQPPGDFRESATRVYISEYFLMHSCVNQKASFSHLWNLISILDRHNSISTSLLPPWRVWSRLWLPWGRASGFMFCVGFSDWHPLCGGMSLLSPCIFALLKTFLATKHRSWPSWLQIQYWNHGNHLRSSWV